MTREQSGVRSPSSSAPGSPSSPSSPSWLLAGLLPPRSTSAACIGRPNFSTRNASWPALVSGGARPLPPAGILPGARARVCAGAARARARMSERPLARSPSAARPPSERSTHHPHCSISLASSRGSHELAGKPTVTTDIQAMTSSILGGIVTTRLFVPTCLLVHSTGTYPLYLCIFHGSEIS